MAEDVTWLDLPLTNEPITSMTYFGNGKDAELIIARPTSATLHIPIGVLVVTTGGGVRIQTSAYDDISLVIKYTGDGLRLRGARLGASPFDELPEFREDVASWLAHGGDLGYLVHVEVALTAV